MNSKSKLPVWAAIISGFIAAAGVQILVYSAPAILGFGSYEFLGPLGFPLAVLWFLVPAALATVLSVRLLRWGARHAGGSVKVPAILAVVLLAFLSAYVGLFVSLNMWGT